MVSNVARAMAVALDWSSTPDSRNAAYSYLESVKFGDIRALASSSFILVKKDWSSEIRLQSFKMLQHLVRLRWEELNPAERRNFASLAVDLMSEMANPCEEWALKSQTAALVAEIIRREGVNLWQDLLPSLVSLSNQGPIQAELVVMMLRWLPEDIMVYNEDLEGDRRRLLLRGLTQSLPEILPLLYNLLERHFGAALAEAGQEQMEIAKQHAAMVTATLNAVNSYAEWAPLPDLAKYGVIHGCGFLLSSPDFRLHACEFFKLVCPRKRPIDGASEYDSAIMQIFQILMNISQDLLHKTDTAADIDESELEFAEYICESMVSLGSSNLQSISGDAAVISLYLHQMLGFFRHHKLVLHCQSLPFWLFLMREPPSKSKITVPGEQSFENISSGPGPADSEKSRLLSFVNEDLWQVILDISFQRMLKKEKVHSQAELLIGTLELWSDDFEGKGEFGQYRSRLLELMRSVAYHKPLIAAVKVSERIVAIVQRLLLVPMPSQELAVIESMQLPFESIVSTIFDKSNDFSRISSDVQLRLCGLLAGLLHQLLSLKWTEPELVEVLGHYLEAFGPFLKYNPDAVSSVINKLFELLNSLPFLVKDPATSTSRRARLQICTAFIRIAKASDESLLPHMKDIADTMGYLQKEGRLLRGEHNLLAEAFLITASAAGVQQQQEVLAWLLEPLGKQWTDLEWQNIYLSDPSGFVRIFADTSFMWSIFHTLTFFEKALKRSGVRKGNVNFKNIPAVHSAVLHPMASHLQWMLPPLLKLLRAVHFLWSPPVAQALSGEIRGAMIMSDVERSSLLGDGSSRLPKSALTFIDASHLDLHKEGSSEPLETDIRNWLKGIRDSGYNVVGLSATIGDYFFKYMDPSSVAISLVENVQSMEFRHLRQLVHSSLIPLVKFCPSDMWEGWLEKLLYPVFSHSQQALSRSWSSLMQEGRAEVPDLHGIEAGSDLRVEVMEEKLLRGLTREICSLLSALAYPAQNSGLPSLEQSGRTACVDVSSLRDVNVFASSSMIGFLVDHKGLAVPALQLSIEAFRWADSEAVVKVCNFCASVVLLAVHTKNLELKEFVSNNLFSAVIQGLALESNAIISHELVGLCREIFAYFSDRDPAPRQILLSLPSITHQDLLAFEDALSKTSSAKEQKQHMRSLLLLATGNKLKALAAPKSVNVITNVSVKDRNPIPQAEGGIGEGEAIGLATIV